MRRVLLGLFAVLCSVTVHAEAQDKEGGRITPMCPGGCPGGVVVTPDGDPVAVLAYTGGHTAAFVAKNTGTSFASVTLTCSTTGPLSCGTVTPASVALDPNEQIDVTVTYSAGVGGFGEVGLSSGTDYGWYNVTVEAVGPPTIVLQNQNGSNVDRGLCLTTGAGEAAGISCGDLYVTHGMPAYRTLGRDRSLALLYNSATANGLVLVAANVSQPPSTNTPQSIRLFLTVGNPTTGMAKDSAQYASFSAGQTKQMVIGRGITGLATGVYPMTLTARNVYATSTYDATVTGTVLVVNRSASEFGKGWALLGLEQVLTDPGDSTRRVWVAGDGSIRLYTKPTLSSNTFLGAAGDAPDSLVRFDTLCTPGCQKWYRRDLKHGAAVTFDVTGRHAFTRNRVGARTLFTWGTVAGQMRLSTITVPPDTGTVRRYTFHWNATTARLDSIRDPGARRLKSTKALDTLKALTDPDGQVTRFTYTAGRLTKRIYPRKGMNGDSAYTSFAYANNARVTAVNIQTDNAATLFATTALAPWDERGLADSSFTTTSIGAPTTGVGLPSRVDGPIAGLGDASDILVNRFGQPTQLTNLGLGTVTTITYDTAGPQPARVTKVVYPDPTTPGAAGRRVYMAWTARGNLMEVRDSTCHKLAGCTPAQVSTTTYQYNATVNAPDSPTRVTDALGRFTQYAYTSLGLTDSIIDARQHRTKFWYRASGALLGVVDSVTERQVETWTSALADTGSLPTDQTTRFRYNVNGIDSTIKSPLGVTTSYVADALGRITAVYDPLGGRTLYAFDPMNRIATTTRDSAKQTHPGGLNPLLGCDAQQILCTDPNQNPNVGPTLVATYYHGAAGLDSVSDPRGVKRRYMHDARGNVVQELDEFLQARTSSYDNAGLLTRTLGRTNASNPHRDTVSYQYDPMGRRSAMILSSTPHAPPFAAEVVPSDSVSYTYDLLGRVRRSANRHGSITRTYYADGTLRTKVDSLITGRDSASFEYDASGARTTVTRTWLPTGVKDVFTYTYDAKGDLAAMVATWAGGTPAPSTIGFTWDALGRRHRLTYPHGITVNLRYDAGGLLRRQVVYDPTQGIPAGYSNLNVTYQADSVDAMGRALRLRWICGGHGVGSPCPGAWTAWVQSTRYNRFGWLVRSTGELAGAGLMPDETYLYDKSGNRTAKLQGAPGASTNRYYRYATSPAISNVLILDSAATDGASYRTWLTSNANGARVGEWHSANGVVQEKVFNYDALARVTGVRDYQFNTSGAIDCTWYNADGQLFRACENDGAARQIFDGENVAALDAERWVFMPGPGLDDPLVGVYRTPGTGTPYLYFWVSDGQGRQLAVARDNGTLTGNDADLYIAKGGKYAGGTTNAQRFSASRMEGTTAPGVSYFRNRAYDQATGRWLQEDPIGIAGGLNLYQFNGNNPTTFTDPFGLCPCVLPAIPILAGGGGAAAIEAAVAGVLVGGAAWAGANWGRITTWAREKTDKLRRTWEGLHGTPWPITSDGKPHEADHDIPLADGGADAATNVTPRTHDDHVQRHKDNGDFKRWGKRGAPQSAEPKTPPNQDGGQP